MFKLLYKTFYYEQFSYVLDTSKENIIERLDNLFMTKSGLFASPNLTGKFVDFPETFYMTQKWSFLNIQNFEREPAILKGVLSKISDTKTHIDISVRPNAVFLILAVFFSSYGLYNLYKSVILEDTNMPLVGLWLTFFALPVLVLFARNASGKLRKAFEKYMDAMPVEKDQPQ